MQKIFNWAFKQNWLPFWIVKLLRKKIEQKEIKRSLTETELF